MNQRIKLLAEQCATDYVDRDGSSYREFDIEKFAERIVQACADLAESFHRHQYNMTGNLELHEFMRQHFADQLPQRWVCSLCGIDRTKAACPRENNTAGKCPMIGTAQ